MSVVIYPGTFDPFTLGHLDIIERASRLFKEVIVAVVKFPSKLTLFSYEERVGMVRESLRDLENVRVEGFEGLIVEFARREGVRIILRGVRLVADFEYEFQMALTNREISEEVETLFLMPNPKYFYISSRLIKEAAFLGASVEKFLPPISWRMLKEKVNESKSRKDRK